MPEQTISDVKTQLATVTAERDGLAMQIDTLRTHLSAAIAERDRLRAELREKNGFYGEGW